MKPTPEQLEALAEQLELERQQLDLEREEFRKFIRPAMHAFGKMLPEMPLFVQQQHRANLANELHLLMGVVVARTVTGADVDVDKLKARIDYLVAQCAKP